jgi:hypothetical protein
MANDLERTGERGAEQRKRGIRTPFSIRSARVDARDIQFGELLSLDEIRLIGSGLSYDPAGMLRVESVEATFIVTESGLNLHLEKHTEEPLSDLQVALLNGKMRISGRYRMLIPIPFTVTAVPEIVGGARIRLDSKQMSLVGAPIPGFGVEMIGEKINSQLVGTFDASKLPIPVRLTKLTVETGRIHLHAATSIEIARNPPP